MGARPLRRTHFPDGEKALDMYIGELVKREGGQYIKLGTQYHSGLPDRMVLLPTGRTVFLELKSKGGKATPLQLAYNKKLKELGFDAFIIVGGEPIMPILTEIFV